MRKVTVPIKGQIIRNETSEGKSIETMLKNKAEGENIEVGGKTLLYTERKEGVVPLTNIRTDRFELAMGALDTVERSRIAKRDRPGDVKKEDPSKPTGGTEPTQA